VIQVAAAGRTAENTAEPRMSAARAVPTLRRMNLSGQLVGRDRERAELLAALEATAAGHGGVVLVGGEAGIGKTRLASEALAESGLLVLTGEASEEATPAYAPVVAALRSYLRHQHDGLADCGPLTPYLGLLLPELGAPPGAADQATLLEALRCAFETAAGRQPLAVMLDDLQWADDTTVTRVVPLLAAALADRRALVVGVYRTDEIPRGHAIRVLRRDLRRAGRLRELTVDPLDAEATAALATQILGAEPSPSLAGILYDRTQGVPFFVEEFTAALRASDRLRPGRRGVELAGDAALPIPDTLRDAILLRAAQFSQEARGLLEVAAVAGGRFDLALVAEIAGDAGLDEAFESGVVQEAGRGEGRFRHALAREALYGAVPWTRRRTLHRLLAERLKEQDARPALLAKHWLAAHDHRLACPAIVAAAEEFASVHAYRDALIAGRSAAEIWPEGEDEEGRIALLEQIGCCAQLCGELQDAVSSWQEVAEIRRLAGDTLRYGEAQRQLATAYELQGASERALSARREAAASFSRCRRPAEAASELVVAAAYLDSAGSLGAALELVEAAREEAERAGRRDLQVRVLGIEGTVRAKLGELEAGLRAAREGLELALAEDLASTAVDAYQRVANALENAGDYRAAWQTYQSALTFCEARGEHAAAQICLVCLGAILFFTGEWERAVELDHQILESPHAPHGVRMGAKQHLGLIGAARGDAKRARRLLAESGAYAERFERQRMAVWDALGQAWLDESEGMVDVAVERCRLILSRWGQSESLHYPVPALRWATTFLARNGVDREARACAAALARLAGETANPEAKAALAHAIGEVSLLDGEIERATEQFSSALDVLRHLDLPFEAAQTQVRAGVALAAAGERAQGVEQLTSAYRTARKLGARPLAARAVQELAALGEKVEQRLGRRAAALLGGPGLSRRELEVIRLVALGQTNREIARELFLSPRTVDMHVRHILGKLRCRSRADATRKATELGLIS
jgi:DNA-binding NarL/FixJ family response regulator